MIFKYGEPKKSAEEINAYVRKMQLSYWGIFLLYLGVWFFIWRMCVSHEAIVSMDWILTVIYFGYLITQFMLVKRLYNQLKRVSIEKFEREASCYMFAIKLIIIIHIGMRIVFNTLSDSESRIQGNLSQQLSWHYILLGDAITEIFSAFGMILLMTVTFSFEESSLNLMIQEGQARQHVDDDDEDAAGVEMEDVKKAPLVNKKQ